MRRVFLGLICLVLLIGTTGAATYDGVSLGRYDGYQINNYVFEVVEVISDFNGATVNVYNEQGEELASKFISYNTSCTYELEAGDVTVSLESMGSSTVELKFETSFAPWKHEKVAGTEAEPAHESAEYVRPPNLKLEMSADKTRVEAGEQVMVTVTIKNTGDGTARDVVVTGYESPPGGKITFLSGNKKWSGTIESGSDPITFMYTLRALEEGTVTLPRATATYEDTAGRSYSSESQQVTLTIEEPTASLNASTSFEQSQVSMGDEVRLVARVENVGDGEASNVRVTFNLPGALSLESGDSEYFEDAIKPGESEEYEVMVEAVEAGNYTAAMDVYYDGKEAHVQTDVLTVKKTVMAKVVERIESIPIAHVIIPVFIVGGLGMWIVWRHQQYKF